MKRNIPSFLLYMFSFFLIWEWLRPMEQLTDTDNIETFIIFLLISLMSSFLHIKRIWAFILKLIVILYSIHHLYYRSGLFQFNWLRFFMADTINNARMLVGRDWNDLSNEFRTLLFFILLWLMVYLIDYWLLNRQRIFIFFFMTLLYITVLDTFTTYSAKAAIVRTVVTGFTVMGMLTFYRITQKEKVDYDSSFIRRWMVPVAVMISLSVLVGIAAPKASPIWPDPVPYLTAHNDKAGSGSNNAGPHRIGYGTNDSALGGPFIGSDDPVFAYEANGKQYWKMETKDMYTGKGWMASGSTPIPFREGDLVPIQSIPNEVEKRKETANVSILRNYRYNFMMYPAGINKVLTMEALGQVGNQFVVDTTNERISVYNDSQKPAIPQLITVEYSIPKYQASDLMVTTDSPPEMNQKFYEKYTKLPKNIPRRVKELAEEITAGKTNWFDKARAVERYFGNSDYTYDQKNVAVPGKNDDYVDQFLFETKRGYCDNFSTSMAVLLRSIGIPTRWIKGYTGGAFQRYSTSDLKEFYEVTNNNAHSWVEVFFPNQGWVPFEPTKGFTNEIQINFDIVANTAPNQQPATPLPVKKPQQEKKEETVKTTHSKGSFGIMNIWEGVKAHWKRILFVFVLFVAFVFILYRYRGKWTPYGVLLFYKLKKKDDSIGTAYLILLKQLERYGLKRKENQTLRNYASYIDTIFSTREMTRLTVLYEQYLYHQHLPEGTWNDSHELWENLIKRTIA